MPRDASATRAKLIAAAREEFAECGIGGARVERIAQQAGVNKERIYGHFGSKEKLFEAVLAQALEEHTQTLGSPCGDIGEYVGRIYDFHSRNPQVLRLMLWEALHYGEQPLPDEERRAEHYVHKTAAFAQTLGLPPGRDAAVALLMAIGLAAWPLAVPQLTRTLAGGQEGVAATVDGAPLRDTLVAFARRMLPAPASSS
ncbi:TetR family transcriptional regulator [Streptomyces melanogenes]|uniref:TetR family transcriptional regulator n=1 Tax=Streptomyces melanogenes TaxID=67326 RepID=UPI00167DB6BB|nr:TetR family transcriptional regulator [Streptomyces melanogenes]GGP94712.1 TetR family transcriptional regulator [Streptomyces melanogenes]